MRLLKLFIVILMLFLGVNDIYSADYNVCEGGTATIDSSLASAAADSAFDGDYTTRTAFAATADTHWIKYDFLTDTTQGAKQVEGLKIASTGDSCILEYRFSGSNNNTDWTVLVERTNYDSGSYHINWFDNDTLYQYYKVNVWGCKAGATNTSHVMEIEMYEKRPTIEPKNAFQITGIRNNMPLLRFNSDLNRDADVAGDGTRDGLFYRDSLVVRNTGNKYTGYEQDSTIVYEWYPNTSFYLQTIGDSAITVILNGGYWENDTTFTVNTLDTLNMDGNSDSLWIPDVDLCDHIYLVVKSNSDSVATVTVRTDLSDVTIKGMIFRNYFITSSQSKKLTAEDVVTADNTKLESQIISGNLSASVANKYDADTTFIEFDQWTNFAVCDSIFTVTSIDTIITGTYKYGGRLTDSTGHPAVGIKFIPLLRIPFGTGSTVNDTINTKSGGYFVDSVLTMNNALGFALPLKWNKGMLIHELTWDDTSTVSSNARAGYNTEVFIKKKD